MAVAETAGAVDLDRDALLQMYERMVQIRTFEDLGRQKFRRRACPRIRASLRRRGSGGGRHLLAIDG